MVVTIEMMLSVAAAASLFACSTSCEQCATNENANSWSLTSGPTGVAFLTAVLYVCAHSSTNGQPPVRLLPPTTPRPFEPATPWPSTLVDAYHSGGAGCCIARGLSRVLGICQKRPS